jgi:membrane-associated protein
MQILAALNFLDPKHLLETFGTIGLFAIIFAESGLLLGLIFPGDSLLFTAGLLAAKDSLGLHIWAIAPAAFLGAFIGGEIGYWIGRRFGPALFRRPDSRIFKQEYVERSHDFFEHHGSRAIVLSRFVPFVRTLAPMLAGIGEMPRRTFTTFNALGALIWGVGVSVAGYFLGRSIPNIDRYLLPIIGVIIVASLIPPLLEYRKHRKAALPSSASDAQAEAEELKELFDQD